MFVSAYWCACIHAANLTATSLLAVNASASRSGHASTNASISMNAGVDGTAGVSMMEEESVEGGGGHAEGDVEELWATLRRRSEGTQITTQFTCFTSTKVQRLTRRKPSE